MLKYQIHQRSLALENHKHLVDNLKNKLLQVISSNQLNFLSNATSTKTLLVCLLTADLTDNTLH